MSETHPAKQIPGIFEDVAKLTAAVGMVIFERGTDGEFKLLSPPPDWFRNLVPNVQTGGAVSVVEIFPALDAFLPDAEEVWKGKTPQAASDLWSEVQTSGEELHFRAHALHAESRNWLVLELAASLYRERQMVLQYAHDLALQNDTILRLNQAVERATRAKSDFLATMSHEIRTPLNAVLGMAELMAETQLSEEQRKYVGTFQRAGNNLLTLINDILDLSKVESGNLKLESDDFDLFDVASSAVELVQAKAVEKGIAVTQEIALGTPRYVRGDALRLRQALLNLLGNSLKFTHRGFVRLRLEAEPDAPAPGAVRFTIQDSGIGIAKDQIPNLFQSFTQADSSITRKYGGTGLGLAISRKLVEAMGGNIWVESEPGQGSAFHFTARFGLGQASAVKSVPQSDVPTAAPKALLRILVADDSEDNRFLIQSYLKYLPYQLDFAENGAVALEKLRTGAYDLALIDVHMPEMDGYEVATSAREWDKTLPLLALTADAYPSAAQKSAAAGFNAHLTKPIQKQTLLEAIARHAVALVPANLGNGNESYSPSSLASKYLQGSRAKAVEMTIALRKSDFEAIRTTAHNMKGTGAAYGFSRITELGRTIEDAALQKNVQVIASAVRDLNGYLDEVDREECSEPNIPSGSLPHISVKQSLRPLVEMFLERLRASDRELRSAIHNSDFAAVRIFGHNLKGNGANFGFQALSDLGDRLEVAALDNDLETIKRHLEKLRRHLDSLVVDYD